MPFGRRRNRIDRSLRERGVPPEPQHRAREVAATSGPYDEADAPSDGRPRIDLGSVRLPAMPGSAGSRMAPRSIRATPSPGASASS